VLARVSDRTLRQTSKCEQSDVLHPGLESSNLVYNSIIRAVLLAASALSAVDVVFDGSPLLARLRKLQEGSWEILLKQRSVRLSSGSMSVAEGARSKGTHRP